ncbi:phytanoyl-CoA dioxygenase family protein [Terricaulis silvestris]|uniref:Chlorinating enzyme n=1 Tax=Terricaulis silvestris TaxID=2686094 RepID=A0A6I6MIS5_9CAUL|nr:phytanoyl-CoA dioxygenase family protein [Terricaulis silvestris]QGZ93681.1 chlorinating enzyme [Terricaulis silvestris]
MTMQAERTRDAAPVVTDAEVQLFLRDGFVLPERGLPPEDTAAMVAACEEVFCTNANWQNLLRMPHIPKRPDQDEGVQGGEHLFKFAIHPMIIEAARRLVGDNIIMWGGEIFAKPPGVGKATPWHQDCYNPAVKPGPGRARARSAMIWIAIDNCDEENGCLRFIPGSGGNGLVEHIRDDKSDALLSFEADTHDFDVNSSVPAIRRPGQYSAHDLYCVHGAQPNNSSRRRAGLTFHYMNSEDAYDRSFGDAVASGQGRKPAPLASRPIWLVLGENKNPINDFRRGHQNLEDLDEQADAMLQQLNKQRS